MIFFKKFRAFSLAEFMITLAIIGVIAALVLPNVMDRVQKKVWAGTLKNDFAKIQSVLKSAMATEQNDEIGQTMLGQALRKNYNNTSDIPKDVLNQYFKAAEYSITRLDYRGFGGYSISYDGSGYNYFDKLLTIEFPTSTVYFDHQRNDNDRDISYWIDVNGRENKPNKVGVDMFKVQLDNKANLKPTVPGFYCQTDGKTAYHVLKNSHDQGMACFQRIVDDGWKIKYNSPRSYANYHSYSYYKNLP